jgi:phosphoglycolate phosphatase-like HAD superfamily hydrolase
MPVPSSARHLLEISGAALLDFDDTMMATRLTRRDALIKACEDFGQAVTPSDIAEHWGKPFRQLILALVPDVDYERFLPHYANVMLRYHPEALPGVRPMLSRMRELDKLVAVVTSSSRSLVEQDLQVGGLLTFVWRLWAFEDTPVHKPNPLVLEPALVELSRQGVGTDTTVYVGDSLADFAVALGNGVRFIAVLTGTTSRRDFQEHGLDEDYIITSFAELYDERLMGDR